MFLLDTNVISALAPMRGKDRAELADWLHRASDVTYLSVVTASEVTAGIEKARREGASAKAAALTAWWDAVEHLYGHRLLPFDLRTAHVAGAIMDRVRAYDPGFEDIVIAATAKVHDLVVLTANERHFAPMGVAILNPLKSLPPLPG